MCVVYVCCFGLLYSVPARPRDPLFWESRVHKCPHPAGLPKQKPNKQKVTQNRLDPFVYTVDPVLPGQEFPNPSNINRREEAEYLFNNPVKRAQLQKQTKE